MMKKEHYIFGLIGIGAAIVLYWLWRESNAASQPSTATGAVIPTPSGQPSYPNAQPINLGNVTINDGTAPASQFAHASNTVPRVSIGTAHSDCGCDDDDCEQAGTPVTVQSIPQEVLQAASDNLAGFMAKVEPPKSGVEAARRISLSTNTIAPAGGGSFSAS